MIGEAMEDDERDTVKKDGTCRELKYLDCIDAAVEEPAYISLEKVSIPRESWNF